LIKGKKVIFKGKQVMIKGKKVMIKRKKVKINRKKVMEKVMEDWEKGKDGKLPVHHHTIVSNSRNGNVWERHL
jgi:hypothetical protein